uniref:Uncharacterized protein n=1 Tax=Steinernema glaseri TaxID=37863 RepID=A0A1I8AIY5_9BILA
MYPDDPSECFASILARQLQDGPAKEGNSLDKLARIRFLTFNPRCRPPPQLSSAPEINYHHEILEETLEMQQTPRSSADERRRARQAATCTYPQRTSVCRKPNLALSIIMARTPLSRANSFFHLSVLLTRSFLSTVTLIVVEVIVTSSKILNFNISTFIEQIQYHFVRCY